MEETVISFFVSVPVLSLQMTVVQPSVSTEGSFLINAFFLTIFCMPIESEMVTIAGRPSGMAATARAIAVMRSSVLDVVPFFRMLKAKMMMQMTMTMMP